MPQVDEADLGDLINWMNQRGVDVTIKQVPPRSVRGHQKVVRDKVRHIPACALAKPVLISKDNLILDGNHRWMAHVTRHHTTMLTAVVDRPFDEALALLKEFPGAYEYGDGNYHPETY